MLLAGSLLAVVVLGVRATVWTVSEDESGRRQAGIAGPELLGTSARERHVLELADEEERAPEPTGVGSVEADAGPWTADKNQWPDFLRYPNEGADDYTRKYAGLSAAEMESLARLLNDKLTGEVNAAADLRFANGLHEVSSIDSYTRNALPELDSGVTSGRTWKAVRADPSGRVMTTVLDEREHPEIFAHRDETVWLIRSCAAAKRAAASAESPR